MGSTGDWYKTAVDDYKVKVIPFEEFGRKKTIGEGGFGVVSLTTCTSISEAIVLKKVSVIDDDQNSVKDFLNELKLHSSSEHERIIKLLGVCRDEENDSYYFVMEFADEGDMRSYLSNKKDSIQWKEKIRLATQIAEGISYIHNELNIAHRDLHSRNILIHKGNIKISDFGLSRCFNDTVTTNSKIFGVIPFIDPQKFINQHYKLDKRSDTYSLGVVFWEISSCHPPFNSNLEILLNSSRDLREKHVSGTPLQYIQLYSDCWDTDPTRRPKIDMVIDRLQTIDLTSVLKDSSPASSGISGSYSSDNSIDSMMSASLSTDIISKSILPPKLNNNFKSLLSERSTQLIGHVTQTMGLTGHVINTTARNFKSYVQPPTQSPAYKSPLTQSLVYRPAYVQSPTQSLAYKSTYVQPPTQSHAYQSAYVQHPTQSPAAYVQSPTRSLTYQSAYIQPSTQSPAYVQPPTQSPAAYVQSPTQSHESRVQPPIQSISSHMQYSAQSAYVKTPTQFP